MSGGRAGTAVLAAAMGLAVLAASCGTARRGAPLTGEHQLPSERIVLGQRIFDEHCSQCHPGGAGGLGPALNNKPLPTWLMRIQVRNGLGAMPAFSTDDIGGDELDALLEYLVWLRRLDWKETR